MQDEQVFTVSQVNHYLNDVIKRDRVLLGIEIEGEVTGASTSRGHLYFTLKDEDSAIDCTMFNYESKEHVPKNGEKIIVKCSVDYYIKKGKLSFKVSSVKPLGDGNLNIEFLKLKKKLEDMGLFKLEHKKQIPRYPNKIGVITSPTGAVVRDILKVTKRRNKYVDIVIYPSKIQGEGAEDSIVEGIDYFNYSDVDIVIIARGGGSMEDLSPFNSEIVALKTFDCVKPTISAIGHETDFTLIDFVSDLRASTPSVAGELAVRDINDIASNFLYYLEKLDVTVKDKYLNFRKEVKNNTELLTVNTNRILDNTTNKIINFINNISHLTQTKIDACESKTRVLTTGLEALNPASVLLRGYSKVSKSNKDINSISEVNVNDKLKVIMHNGNFECTVNSVNAKGDISE